MAERRGGARDVNRVHGGGSVWRLRWTCDVNRVAGGGSVWRFEVGAVRGRSRSFKGLFTSLLDHLVYNNRLRYGAFFFTTITFLSSFCRVDAE